MTLTESASIGQTFFARYRGLSGVEVFIQPSETKTGHLILGLYESARKDKQLAESRLSLKDITTPDFYQFTFAPQNDSINRDYYLEIISSDAEAVEIGIGSGVTYLDGALYLNGEPQDNQLTFRLAYDPSQLALGLLLLGLSWIGILLVAGFLFILPGWAALGYLDPGWKEKDWGEKLALSAGVSLAIYPILFLWTELTGLHLGSAYAWLPALAGLGVILWRNRRWRFRLSDGLNFRSNPKWLYAFRYSDLALMILLGLIFTTRFWVIRNLEVPLWGDSYQHTMIAQLLVDNNGLFDSWEPYAELQTFSYHFGFHTLAAVFHWITNITMPKSVLWSGQILNGLAIVSLYPLAIKVGKNRWAGVLAVLLAGLLSPMPMYYLNWGRYTQLAGQVILPAAAMVIWTVLDKKEADFRLIALSSILMGGLALTHYRVLIFAVVFVIAVILFQIDRWKSNLLVYSRSLLLSAVGALLIFLPWLIHIVRGKIVQIFLNQVTTAPANISNFTQQYNAIGDPSVYLPVFMWVLLLLALGSGFWRRDKDFAILSLWAGLVLLAANPQWFNLPGAGSITNFAALIAAYLPASILIGAAASWLALDLIGKRHGFVSGQFALAVSALGLGIWGFAMRIDDLNVIDHALVTRADLRAAEWIKNSTDAEAKFLVNSFFAYGNSSIVGSDGGWWLPLLAERKTTLPPLTYTSEKGPRPDYREWTNSLTAEILDRGVHHGDVFNKLAKRNVTHVYIGQRDGQLNSAGIRLDEQQLRNSPHFREIYHQDSVRIFEILR